MTLAFMLAFAVLVIGLVGLMMSKNVFKTIVSLNIMQTALIILFILAASQTGIAAPIVVKGMHAPVDPLPQALMITAIVIGASITALVLMFSIKLFHYYGSMEWQDIFREE